MAGHVYGLPVGVEPARPGPDANAGNERADARHEVDGAAAGKVLVFEVVEPATVVPGPVADWRVDQP